MSGVDLFNRPTTADDGARNANDYYETAPWMTASLLHHHPITGRILEPCAGDGAIARVLVEAGCDVLTNDIDSRHRPALNYDATQGELWSDPFTRGVDWVITNPPFNIAFPILEQAWLLARVGVAFLLRKTFLEPTDTYKRRGVVVPGRGGWLSVHPPTRIIGLPRHRFRGKGNDSVSCDWMIWEKQPRLHLPNALPPIVVDHLAKTRRVK